MERFTSAALMAILSTAPDDELPELRMDDTMTDTQKSLAMTETERAVYVRTAPEMADDALMESIALYRERAGEVIRGDAHWWAEAADILQAEADRRGIRWLT